MPADGSLCRRVWLRLVGNFDACTTNSMCVEQTTRFGGEVRRIEEGVGARGAYDSVWVGRTFG